MDVEIKEESRPTFDALVTLLARYRDLFSPDGESVDDGHGAAPIEVVLVGWEPPALPDSSPVPLGRQLRLRNADGRAVAITDPAVRLISLDYYKTMGRWWMTLTPGRRQRWLSTLRAVKAGCSGRRIRVYHVPVDKSVYQDLVAAGVDLIGTQSLAETARLLHSASR